MTLPVTIFCLSPVLLDQIPSLPIIIGNLPIEDERSTRFDIALPSVRWIEDDLSHCSRRARQSFRDHRLSFEILDPVCCLFIVELARECVQRLLHLLFILRIDIACVLRHHRDFGSCRRPFDVGVASCIISG